MKKTFIIISIIISLLIISAFLLRKPLLFYTYEHGDAIDSLNHVKVFYNGSIKTVKGRNLTEDGYNLGLKYQCVEFVKRYYYEHLNHKMPDSWGHAESFFNPELQDGQHNKKRNLTQYTNPSISKPKPDDLIVMKGSGSNNYGHVAIVSKVFENDIEIIQQNPGAHSPSRKNIDLSLTKEGKWKIENDRISGWLRK